MKLFPTFPVRSCYAQELAFLADEIRWGAALTQTGKEVFMVYWSFMLSIAIGLTAVFVLFGWLSPLIAGLALRRTPPPSPRPWLVTSAIWGGISAIIITGLIFWGVSLYRGFDSDFSYNLPDATEFDVKAYSGPTVALAVPEGMTVRMTLGPAGRQGEQQAWDFESDGAILHVPSGKMQIYALHFSMYDAAGVEWRLGSSWRVPLPFDASEDTAPWMGPLRAGVQVTSSPLNDDLRAALQFADAAGRPYALDAPCGGPDSAQNLAITNAQGEELWSGRFSFG